MSGKVFEKVENFRIYGSVAVFPEIITSLCLSKFREDSCLQENHLHKCPQRQLQHGVLHVTASQYFTELWYNRRFTDSLAVLAAGDDCAEAVKTLASVWHQSEEQRGVVMRMSRGHVILSHLELSTDGQIVSGLSTRARDDEVGKVQLISRQIVR